MANGFGTIQSPLQTSGITGDFINNLLRTLAMGQQQRLQSAQAVELANQQLARDITGGIGQFGAGLAQAVPALRSAGQIRETLAERQGVEPAELGRRAQFTPQRVIQRDLATQDVLTADLLSALQGDTETAQPTGPLGGLSGAISTGDQADNAGILMNLFNKTRSAVDPIGSIRQRVSDQLRASGASQDVIDAVLESIGD